MKLEFFFS